MTSASIPRAPRFEDSSWACGTAISEVRGCDGSPTKKAAARFHAAARREKERVCERALGREVLELVLFLSACPACESFRNLEDSMSESAQVPGLTNKLQPGDGRPRKKQHWRRGSCATVRSCARSTNAQGRDDPGLERRKDVIRGRQRAQPIRVVRSLRLARTWFLVSCTRSFVSLRCSSTAGSMLVFMRSRRKP